MEYKRLTRRFKNSQMQQDVELMETVSNGVFRLAELEDKIERGTLIELPCKVGDRFYQVVKGLPIYEWEVETIVFSNVYFPKNYVITAGRSKDLARWKFWSEDFGKTLFLTREEAEKRLLELQREAKL